MSTYTLLVFRDDVLHACEGERLDHNDLSENELQGMLTAIIHEYGALNVRAKVDGGNWVDIFINNENAASYAFRRYGQ